MSRKTIIYICIAIVILIIIRILYSTFFSNTEGFDINNNNATDLLSKLKSSDAQKIVNSSNTNLEMQISSWNNKIYNMQNLANQSKAIAFYKPNLMINNIQYLKLGDIVSQNTDYSLPSVDQFTLLVKKNTSDIKNPIRFDLVAKIDNINFNSNYYDFSNYVSNSLNINIIKNSLINCASAINNLNTLIQNNLSTIQNKFIYNIYNGATSISVDSSSISILKFLKDKGKVRESFDGINDIDDIYDVDDIDNIDDIDDVEGFVGSSSTVDTGYTDFIPSPLITTPYTNTSPSFNLAESNSNNYNVPVTMSSNLVLPSGTNGYITYNGQRIDISIPSNIDSGQDKNVSNILNKLPYGIYGNLTNSNISFYTQPPMKLFSYIPINQIINYIIALCNDIENIYNNQAQSQSQTQSENLLSYLNLAPTDITKVRSLITVMNSNSNNINTLTLQDLFTQISNYPGLGLNFNTLSNTTTLIELVLYIINNISISYNLTYLKFTPSQINSIVLASTNKNITSAQTSYLGCYNDSNTNLGTVEANDKNRTLPDFIGRTSSVEQCALIAIRKQKEYDTIGLQNGGDCWAGTAAPNYAKFGAAENCPPLGGPMVNQVYSIVGNSITITNFSNDIVSNIPASTYNILSNPSFNSIQITSMNNILSNINKFSQFISNFSNKTMGYFPLQIYKPIAPDNYTTMGHVFCNSTTDLQKIIDSNNVACVPSHCVKPIRDWTVNDKIFEYNTNGKYFAIYFNPYTGTFISTNVNAQQLPEGKVSKVVACVKKCTAVEDLQKADDCARKYYNLNKEATENTPLNSTLASNQEEEYYLDKIQTQSESITRLKQRAQNMQTTIDKATIVNREMNKNKLQDYVDVQKQNIDIIMKKLQDDKNKIQTNVNIPYDTLNSIMDMIKNSSSLSSDQKSNLLKKIISTQNLPNAQYITNMNQILNSCPQYDLTGLISKQMASDVCYGCDTPK